MKRSHSTLDEGQASKAARVTKEDEKTYGNYKAYYTSRRVAQGEHAIDPRIDLLSDELFKEKKVLDIGCNSGNITIALAKQKKPRLICGVDIDPELIKNAKNNIKIVYSLSQPEQEQDGFDLTLKRHYFPLAMTHLHGFIAMNLPEAVSRPGFPYNAQFRASDWTLESLEKESYDTILALSVTKWIQLHTGDEGLQAFFKKIYDSLKAGGTLVLESQEFGTFQKRAKVLEVDADTCFHFRPEHYQDYLLNTLGFQSYQDLGVPKDESKGKLLFV